MLLPVLAIDVALATCAPSPQPTESRATELTESLFGVVVASGDAVCLRLRSDQPPPPDSIAIILPGEARAFAGAVGERLDSCTADVGAGDGVAYFAVEASVIQPGQIGIAILATAAVRPGEPRTDLDGDGQPESYRSCTSYEGVHLTVWSGEALSSRRVWHAYRYLGYDTEPSCTDGETG